MTKFYDLARMSTPTTGTGTITLGAAAPSFLSFAGAGVSDGDTITYAIQDGANSEIGHGVYTESNTTLTRTVLKSTNSNSAIALSGFATVVCTIAAEDFKVENMTDVDVSTLNDGEALIWNAAEGKFKSQPAAVKSSASEPMLLQSAVGNGAVSFGTTPTAGNLVVVLVANNVTSSDASLSRVTCMSNDGINTTLFTRRVTTANQSSGFTFSGSEVAIMEFSGAEQVIPASLSGTAISPLPADNAMVMVFAGGYANPLTFSGLSTGYTQLQLIGPAGILVQGPSFLPPASSIPPFTLVYDVGEIEYAVQPFYVLGQTAGGSIATMTDVTGTPSDGDFLQYSSTSGTWVPAQPTFADCADVDMSGLAALLSGTPTGVILLEYDYTTTHKWKPVLVSSSGSGGSGTITFPSGG